MRTSSTMVYSIKPVFLLCLAALLALWLGVAQAAGLSGKVIRVSDGDSITVLDSANQQYKVRVMGIDAPEKGQPFGTKSRESLSSMVAGRHVTVAWQKKDRYGRVLGVVFADGRDVGLIQIERGFAWHYKAYQRDQSTKAARGYAEAEDAARTARRGLWADRNPVPPWEYRKAGRAK